MRILLVEDEENYRDPLAFGLRRDGAWWLRPRTASAPSRSSRSPGARRRRPHRSGPAGPHAARLDGIRVCTRIRRSSSVPVIMLTAKDTELDKIVGLEIGADDYVTSPTPTGSSWRASRRSCA